MKKVILFLNTVKVDTTVVVKDSVAAGSATVTPTK